MWSTVVEQILREKKLWGHVMGTTIPPPSLRVVALVVSAFAATLGVNSVVGAPEITQEMVDQDQKTVEDFDATAAQANVVLLHTMKPRDVMATTMLLTPSAKWEKHAHSTSNVVLSIHCPRCSKQFIYTIHLACHVRLLMPCAHTHYRVSNDNPTTSASNLVTQVCADLLPRTVRHIYQVPSCKHTY